MASSLIDPAVFPDNMKVDKANLRTQFTVAKNEITALDKLVRIPSKMAYNDAEFDTA